MEQQTVAEGSSARFCRNCYSSQPFSQDFHWLYYSLARGKAADPQSSKRVQLGNQEENHQIVQEGFIAHLRLLLAGMHLMIIMYQTMECI